MNFIKGQSSAFLFIIFISLILTVTGCGKTLNSKTDLDNQSSKLQDIERKPMEEESSEMRIFVNVNDNQFSATLENNEATDELVTMMKQGPITIQFKDYAGFEKVGFLGSNLSSNDAPITTKNGDIVLYQGNQIVLFYGSNSWSYTRLGHINDVSGWKEALGDGEVTVTFSLVD